MIRLALTITLITCVTTPALGQDIAFFDDFEGDTGFWLDNMCGGSFVDHRAVDPLDPTNQAISPPNHMYFFCVDPFLDSWTVPIPVDPGSTYVLSFRFLDESPDYQRGRVELIDDPTGGTRYSMPFELIADGTWHEYSFEFTPGELFDPGTDSISLVLFGPRYCQYETPPGVSFSICDGETPNYYDDIILERFATVPNEAVNWGGVKALYR